MLNGGSKPESLEACMNNAERTYDACLNECEDGNEASLLQKLLDTTNGTMPLAQTSQESR